MEYVGSWIPILERKKRRNRSSLYFPDRVLEISPPRAGKCIEKWRIFEGLSGKNMGEKIRVNDPPKKGRKTGKKSPKYLRTVTSKIVPPRPQKRPFLGTFRTASGGAKYSLVYSTHGSCLARSILCTPSLSTFPKSAFIIKTAKSRFFCLFWRF